jgi:hypothetical protein
MISAELEAVLFKATGMTYAQRKAAAEQQRADWIARTGGECEPSDVDLAEIDQAAYNAEVFE